MCLHEADSTTNEEANDVANNERRVLKDDTGVIISIENLFIGQDNEVFFDIKVRQHDGSWSDARFPALFIANHYPVSTMIFLKELYIQSQEEVFHVMRHAPELLFLFIEPLI